MYVNQVTALSVAVLFGSVAAAAATTVTVATTPGTPYVSPVDIRDDTGSRGVDLVGAQVTATYSNTTSEVLTWGALDPYTPGEARGDDFAIYMDYRGFDIQSTKQLTHLKIELANTQSISDGSGRSVFDMLTADNNDPGNTPSSAFGVPVRFDNTSYTQATFFGALLPSGQTTDAPEGTIIATYSDIVRIGAAPAQGDLFSTLNIDFTGLSAGFFQGDANFEADVDTFRTVAPIPLPAGLPLLLLGLSGLALVRRTKA